MKLWIVVLAITVMATLGASPVLADQSEPTQEESALTVQEAQSLSEEYGFEFHTDDPDNLPTRTEIMSVIQALQNTSLETVLDPNGAAGSAGATGSSNDEEDRSCGHNQGVFAAIFQYLTLELGSSQSGRDAYVDLIDHDVELRTWFVIPPEIGGRLLQEMWISHVKKSDEAYGSTGWKATAKMTLW